MNISYKSRLPYSTPDGLRIIDKYGNLVAWVSNWAADQGNAQHLIRAGNEYDQLAAENARLRMELETANSHRQHLLTTTKDMGRQDDMLMVLKGQVALLLAPAEPFNVLIDDLIHATRNNMPEEIARARRNLESGIAHLVRSVA